MSDKNRTFRFVPIPNAEFADVRVEWPVVGTQGVVVDDADDDEGLLAQLQSMRPGWSSVAVVPGGVFVASPPQQLWDIEHEDVQDIVGRYPAPGIDVTVR